MRRLALVGCLAVLAGCGGGDGDALSREEYVSRLDEICADLDARQKEIGQPQSLDEFVEKGGEIQEELGVAIQRIRDLGEPPDEIAGDVELFLALGDELHSGLGELVNAAEANELEHVQQVVEDLERIDEDSDRVAGRLGASRCAAD